MKPIKAKCTRRYSSIGGTRDEHFIIFSVLYANDPVWHKLEIKVDEDDKPLSSQVDRNASETWQEQSWQNALFSAWKRYTAAMGYCAATTAEKIYELISKEDGSYCYDLEKESQKAAFKEYTYGRMFDKTTGKEVDVVLVPSQVPTYFY